MIRTGLDRLLEDVRELSGRRYAILAHAASVSDRLEPIHLALERAGADPPARLFGPEHGFFGVEQDMVASANEVDPWTGTPIVSLYGDSKESLRPVAAAFEGLDLLIVDLQDVGSRYYTYAATAVWSTEVALAAGCEVWVLDRPNPLGGAQIEGNRRKAGFESFIGAFEVPVRHGLTLAELVQLTLSPTADRTGLRLWPIEGWTREMTWDDTGRVWVAPSPNIPTISTAFVYPGGCLLEATEISEGRGTTRPFELIGAPGLDARAVADHLNAAGLEGVRFAPTFFKPKYQKHAGRACAGVRWFVTDPGSMRAFRCGVEILGCLHQLFDGFAWRTAPYEFEVERPAVDLLAGDSALREALDGDGSLESWIESWQQDEVRFREDRAPHLVYPD